MGKYNGSTAHSFLSALGRRGVKYVFANAGTDFAPVVEALSAPGSRRNDYPKFIVVPHENVAVAMAQGYFHAIGDIAAVMVHVNVGTANAMVGIMNANRSQLPVLLMAGRTPVTEDGHIGSRNGGIHWGQEAFDQGGMLREYVKWDYELKAGQPVESIVGRALDIAMSEPRGPVYLTLPREVLSDENVEPGPGPRDRVLGAIAAVPSPDAIDRAAKIMAEAVRPLIVTSGFGSSPEMPAALAALVEEFAIPVVQVSEPRLPSNHPMNMGYAPGDFLPKADAVMVIDCPVPWIPRNMEPADGAKLIHISNDPLYSRYPFRGYEMDVAISGNGAAAVELLKDAMAGKVKGRKRAIQERGKRLKSLNEDMRKARADRLKKVSTETPISPLWVAECINRVKGDDAIIINELGIPPAYLDLDNPGKLMGSSLAGGLGHGLGAALGAKLAKPDIDVILTVGDGSYIFGNPTAAHYVGRSEKLATLNIITNNSMWFAVKNATTSMYPDGVSSKVNSMPLTELNPSPDFELIIQSCGGYGERVDDPAKLEDAMRRGLEMVRAGTPVLLNVITSPGGRR